MQILVSPVINLIFLVGILFPFFHSVWTLKKLKFEKKKVESRIENWDEDSSIPEGEIDELERLEGKVNLFQGALTAYIISFILIILGTLVEFGG